MLLIKCYANAESFSDRAGWIHSKMQPVSVGLRVML